MKVLLSLLQVATATAAVAVEALLVVQDLKTLVLPSSSVSIELQARWSDFNAPLPAVVVNVTRTGRRRNSGIPFLAQNGGVGWAKTFDLGENGVLINLAGLNAVTVSRDKKQATIGGGASTEDTIAAANAAGALVLTGNCNCVGAVSAYLGGGYGNLMGEVGFGVDNVISLRVATANGKLLTVSKTSHPDLFWAMRGAGPNFGIVLSATVNAVPATPTERTAWINNLFFTPDKLPQIAQAIQDLPLTPEQRIYLVLASSGPPLNEPIVLVTGFLHKGTEETGLAAFKSIYDVGPSTNSSAITPYEHWNDANNNFCIRGARKPAFSTTLTSMQPETWPKLWDLYKTFQAHSPNTAMLIERYDLKKARSAPAGSAAFNPALRAPAFAQAIVVPWYADAGLDGAAVAFGRKVREIWSDEADATANPTNVNSAHGDERLEAIYGASLPRLRVLKKKWDPEGVFGQWFAIK